MKKLRAVLAKLRFRGLPSLLASLAAAGGLAAAWIYGVPHLQAYALRRQSPPAAIQVSLPGRPAWVDADLAGSLVQVAAKEIGPDPFRRDDLAAARSALLATGWFHDVTQVTRLAPGRIEIQARFVQPCAVVQDGHGRLHLVDAEARLLPRSYAADRAPRLPTIRGAGHGPPAAPGRRWSGEDVPAAIALLRLVRERAWLDQVDHVDVARHPRDGSLRLVTDRGCTIIWGRRPGEEGGAEVPASQKLGYLDYHFRNYGHIDRGLKELDVTGDVVVGR
jgi:hypothetical protein